MIARSRPLALALALALAWLASTPRPARAQSSIEGSSLTSFSGFSSGLKLVTGLSVAGGLVGLAELVLVGADVVSWVMGTPFDDGWAVVDVVAGALFVTAGACLAGFFIVHDSIELAAVSSVGVALGGLNIAHAAWSLASRAPPPPIVPMVRASDDGATFAIAGSF